jgi:hypothetical protein
VEPQAEKQTPLDSQTPTWSALVIVAILSQMFWWYVFASPFLGLFTRLVTALEKIAN